MTNDTTEGPLTPRRDPAAPASQREHGGEADTRRDSEETVGGALKSLGLAIVILPVALGIAFVMYNMARYNYECLPNPIAFVMMLVEGAFGLIAAVAGPGVFCIAVYHLLRILFRKSRGGLRGGDRQGS